MDTVHRFVNFCCIIAVVFVGNMSIKKELKEIKHMVNEVVCTALEFDKSLGEE